MTEPAEEIKPGYTFQYKPWWFMFEVDNWLLSEDVLSMTGNERATYINLLCFQWKNPRCMIQKDVKKLQNLPGIISKTLNGNSKVISKFVEHGEFIYNKKLWEQRRESELLSIKRAKSGKRGGEKVKQLVSNSLANDKEKPSNSQAIEEQTTVKVKTTVTNKTKNTPKPPQGGQQGLWFFQFWELYPNKCEKILARKRWDKLKPDAALFGIIIEAVKRQSKSTGWTKDNGQYVPNPARWLLNKRWEDEPPPENTPESMGFHMGDNPEIPF